MDDKAFKRIPFYVTKSQDKWLKKEAARYKWPNNNYQYVLRLGMSKSDPVFSPNQDKESDTIGR